MFESGRLICLCLFAEIVSVVQLCSNLVDLSVCRRKDPVIYLFFFLFIYLVYVAIQVLSKPFHKLILVYDGYRPLNNSF